jgi:hypothetical protein
MNNEQQQIIDEAYENYLTYIHDVVQGENQIYGDWYGKEEFINKCKTNPEFSNKWGLTIEERELSLEERTKLAKGKVVFLLASKEDSYNHARIPSKLITITYNDKTIESYE